MKHETNRPADENAHKNDTKIFLMHFIMQVWVVFRICRENNAFYFPVKLSTVDYQYKNTSKSTSVSNTKFKLYLNLIRSHEICSMRARQFL